MKANTTTILVHIFSWLLVMFLPYLFAFPPERIIKNLPVEKIDRNSIRVVMTLTMVFLCAVFYTNFLILIPRFQLKKKRAAFFCGNLILLLSFLWYQFFSSHWLVAAGLPDSLADFPGPSIPMFIIVVMICYGVRISTEWRRAELANHALATEKATAEISYLKKQINPHFFFNTLNGIYALTIKKSDLAPQAILQLSNMMRYVLYDSEAEKVPLTKEMKYIRSYIDMQSFRLSENNKIYFHVSDRNDSAEILPLLLIPFVENAFKFGISADDDTTILIDIKWDDTALSFFCRNQKKNRQSVQSEHHGIGIKNVQKRLHLSYPGRHELNIYENEEIFSVSLNIQL
jgi:two-component system, LytTR family, sensor kinase